MQRNDYIANLDHASVLTTNKVLRNTYILVSLTILFSAAMAALSMAIQAPAMNPFVLLICYFGLLFGVHATRNSSLGLLMTFALTGFLGFTLGPMLSYMVSHFQNGPQIIVTALGATGVIFLALSGYVMTTRTNFNYLSGFLFVGFCVAMLASIAGLFFQMPMLNLIVSSAFVLLSSGVILYETSNIIHGGETNYITATVSIYVALFNIFVNLLHIFSAFSGRDE